MQSADKVILEISLFSSIGRISSVGYIYNVGCRSETDGIFEMSWIDDFMEVARIRLCSVSDDQVTWPLDYNK